MVIVSIRFERGLLPHKAAKAEEGLRCEFQSALSAAFFLTREKRKLLLDLLLVSIRFERGLLPHLVATPVLAENYKFQSALSAAFFLTPSRHDSGGASPRFNPL